MKRVVSDAGKGPVMARLLTSDCFCLEVDGVSAAGFVSCSGLSGRVEVFEYVQGGAESPSCFAGQRSYGPLVMRRGLTVGSELYNWFLRGDRRDGAIVLISRRGQERMRWEFLSGWPCAWEGPRLDANFAGAAIEAVEIAHEGIRCRST